MNKNERIQNTYEALKNMLKGESATHTDIVKMAEMLVQIKGLDASVVNKIVYEYEGNHTAVKVAEPGVLTSDPDNSKWFEKKRPVVESRQGKGYFDRYAHYLKTYKDFDDTVVDNMRLTAEKVLKQCANPDGSLNANSNKKRGLVVGDVQSGKTANYLALINLACDYGYDAIVLLAGMTDSLRIQTQKRIDSGFIGAKSSTIGNSDIAYIGVGIPDNDRYAIPFTDTELDYVKWVHKHNHAMFSDLNKPVVLVVKKNASVLKQVAEKLRSETKKKNILIIDDESDNASVNTKKEDSDPSAINRRIRDIFNDFPIATYVGFTATPFANIFINPFDDDSYKDLFPSEFIVQLESPSTYFGANKVFSYDDNNDSKHLRILDEYETNALPVKHKKTERFLSLPESLKEAILCFLIDNVIRTIRLADDKHRSMMINISVFNDLHEDIRDVVSSYICKIRNIIEQDEYKDTEEFIKNSEMKMLYDIFMGQGVYSDTDFYSEIREKIDWESIKSGLFYEIDKFEVAIFNNKYKKERFDYDDEKYSEHGARVIAVGGYVLSRGLTLEGLMISYFSRSSSTYDALLQMCRWFGYRPNYEDLCRVYISRINIMNFRAVIEAVENLKDQFKEMEIRGQKPEAYGLMVQEAPDILETSLLITSRNKQRSTSVFTHYINYGGHYADTSKLYIDRKKNLHNIDVVDKLFSAIEEAGYEKVRYIPDDRPSSSPEQIAGKYMYSGIDASLLAKYIAELLIPTDNTKFDVDNIASYIKDSNVYKKWDVVIASGSHRGNGYKNTALVERSFQYRNFEDVIRIGKDNNRVMDPGIFECGLSQKQIDAAWDYARERARNAGKKPPKTLSAIAYLSEPVGRKNPLFVIYPMYLKLDKEGNSDEKLKIHSDLMQDGFVVGFAIGFPFKEGQKKEKMLYRVNAIKQAEIEKSKNEPGIEEEELYDQD